MASQAPCADEEAGRGRALGLVWRALSRRAHTRAEVRALLERRGIDAAAAAAAIEEVAAAGYLDDGDFAQRYAEDRRRLDGWGGERIGRELKRRGVAAELVAAAVESRDARAELEAACTLLAERLPHAPAGDRERRRALGLLMRRGYEREVAYEAVRRHERRDS